MPLPYPHRATFLAAALAMPEPIVGLAPYVARLISVIVFDHLVRHPVITLGDHDDERLIDDAGRLLDIHHPHAEDSLDWFFRVSRRHEVLWFELSLDAARPHPPRLHARRPDGSTATWSSNIELGLSQQLAQCLAQWLAHRRLPLVGALAEFTLDDLRVVAERLAHADAELARGGALGALPEPPAGALPALAVPFLRVLGELAPDDAHAIDPLILRLEPDHLVARRDAYVADLMAGGDRRAVLPLIAEAPMYAKPHLSVWGDAFAAERPLENFGVRHQGIAASLMPANPYACHNYSLQLAEVGRREESYRWADRATVASPELVAAHLDCVRRLRQLNRPGQAFAEAQYRCREILDRAAAGALAPVDWQAPHHAALLIAFAHLDIGRLGEAIELADAALAELPDDATSQEAFAWARKRVQHWKTDPGLLARAYAWEGHHRGEPGRVLHGLARGRITDEVDATILIDALLAIGRDDEAEIAFWHCAGIDGAGVLGDGKARLAGAKALILRGELDHALDQLQIVQLRRGHSRLEAEINRVLRLAASQPPAAWSRAIARRLELGARTLARDAARDLADFVPGLDTPVIRRALGELPAIVLDPIWTSALIGELPAAQASAPAVLERLARPRADTLAAADAFAQEWWTCLVPPARDRDAHAAGAVLALALALAGYITEACRAPTPIAGAYRHVATEALHLVRRSRYQLEPPAIEALLHVVESLAGAPDWLLDPWLLRVERALDLEADHGSYLDAMIAGRPVVQRLLRGDERIGWELRLAHDLAADRSQYEPAARLFERCARATEGGSVARAWSAAAAIADVAPEVKLDVHWIAALANPVGVAAPWLAVAHGLFAAGRADDAMLAATRGITATPPRQRAAVVASLEAAWQGVATPLDADAAFEAGLAAASEDRHAVAVHHLRWAAAVEPGDPRRAHGLAIALARAGQPLEAVRALAAHERHDAPRLIGRALADAGRPADAVPLLRYASRRFRVADDWAALALAAHRCGDDAVAIEAAQRARALGATDPALLIALARGLYRIGEFVACEPVARQLIADGGSREVRIAGLHAMARALAGQGRHVDAHPYATAAIELAPAGDLAAELRETLDGIVAQQPPPVHPSRELTMERRAYADLEAGRFDALVAAIASPAWAIARAALAACEVRGEDENGIPVAPRALEAAVTILDRTIGAIDPDAVLARIRALRIRDDALIQIDPPPPLGQRISPAELDRAYAERERRPHRPSAYLSFAR